MGRLIAFSELEDYLQQLDSGDSIVKASILDTNIIISSTYEIKRDYDEVIEVLDRISAAGYRMLTTVNTRSEFLEFQRRLILTENLLDSIAPTSNLNLSKSARAAIQSSKGILAVAQGRGSDPVFGDRTIKEIKKAFSAGSHSGYRGWMAISELFLKGQLEQADQLLAERGIEYLSQNASNQKHLFHKLIDWPEANRISEETGMGFFDAMILNALFCSVCPFILSSDFDIAYAIRAANTDKVAVVPDDIVREFRFFHFPGGLAATGSN